jgi:hypothetical protein
LLVENLLHSCYNGFRFFEFGFPITDKTPDARAQDHLCVRAEKELSKADQKWGSKFFEDLIENLRKGRYIKKDIKFLKRIEQKAKITKSSRTVKFSGTSKNALKI